MSKNYNNMSKLSTNEKKEDHLKEDAPVVLDVRKKDQITLEWAVGSFISPEDRIKQRFLFESSKFLYHDVNKQIMDTTVNIARNINNEFNQVLEKKVASYQSSNSEVYKAAAELLSAISKELNLNEDDQVNKVLRKYRIEHDELADRFEVYKRINSGELEAEFNQKYTDETSVRGFKCRGAFPSQEQARKHAKEARASEPGVHSFIYPVGKWVPWDPDADAVQDEDYMLPELNDMMGRYKRNAEQRNEFFAKRQQLMMDESNESKAKKHKEALEQKLANKRNQRKPKQLRETGEMTNKEDKPKANTTNTPQLTTSDNKVESIDKKKKKKKKKTISSISNETKVISDPTTQSLTFEAKK